MTEEQNDSPAFRLRPRRAAPKSYYTTRLEYSANPAAFIRERPRSGNKKRLFTHKTGSNLSKTATANRHYGNINNNVKLAVVSREEREREERRMMLHRDISESITTNTMISPFMQRLQLDELESDSIYEHNYITLRIKEIEQSQSGRLLTCFCHGTDVDSSPNHGVNVRLYNEYADTIRDLVKPEKIISIAKFRTGPAISIDEDTDSDNLVSPGGSSGIQTTTFKPHSSSGSGNNNDNNRSVNIEPTTSPGSAHSSSSSSTELTSNNNNKQSCKIEPSDQNSRTSDGSSSTDLDYDGNRPPPQHEPIVLLPFHVLVKYDELVERSTSNSNRGSPVAASASGSTSSLGGSGASVKRRLLIPFVSITDMIEQPTEPYVEMSSSSPVSGSFNNDHENLEAKKVKFTANITV